MSKINFLEVAEKLRKTIKNKEEAKFISTGDEITTPTKKEDFVVMPEWWQEVSGGLLGLPYGYVVMIAGNPDSGKSSCAIQAIKAAQEQGAAVILADTERKTTKKRLVDWGVDPSRLARVEAPYLEKMYEGIDLWINGIKDQDPDAKILVIVDSLGNTPSFREAEVEEMTGPQQPGVAAKANKKGLKRLIPKLVKDKVALLLINQTYNNLGSPGKSNTGGEGPNYFSALTIQTSRVKWLEETSKGVDYRRGARVQWTVYKNHLTLEGQVKKRTLLDITKDGITVAE